MSNETEGLQERIAAALERIATALEQRAGRSWEYAQALKVSEVQDLAADGWVLAGIVPGFGPSEVVHTPVYLMERETQG